MKKKYFLLFCVFYTYVFFGQQLPTGSSTESGVTEGTLSVSLSGAANYSIPIKLPPGINNVTPQVSLNYNSQAGNGSAGYGWSVSGISSITRIPSTKFHNGNVGTITFTGADNFELDGQRLLVKKGTGGIYGKDGTEYETENYSNLKVTSYGVFSTAGDIGPDYFKVEYPDGSIAYYGYITGNNSNSRSAAHFAITYWENPQGLRISYFYTPIFLDKLNISSIKYGSKNSGAPIHEVNFTYRNKVRQETQFIGGQPIKDALLLTDINVKSAGIPFRNYALNYDLSTLSRERLISITEKSGDNTKSYNPTVFSYLENQPFINWELTSSKASNSFDISYTNSNVLIGDYDGDGDLEFLTPNSDGGSTINKIQDDNSVVSLAKQNIFSFDQKKYVVNSLDANLKVSGKQNICAFYSDSNNYYYRVYSYISGGGSIQLDYQKTSSVSEGGNPNPDLSGDFDGDYLTDLVSIGLPSNGLSSVKMISLDRRVSTGFVTDAGQIDLGTSINAGTSGSISGTHVIKTGDINGDGKTDLIVFRGNPYNDIAVYTLVNNVFKRIVLWPQNMPGDIGDNSNYSPVEFPILLGDYNGDGKSDIFFTSLGKVLTSTGGLYFTEEQLASWYTPPTYPYAPREQIIAHDFNNDGTSDIIRVKPIYSLDSNGNVLIDSEAIEFKVYSRQAPGWSYQYYKKDLHPSPWSDHYTPDDTYYNERFIPLFTRKSKVNLGKSDLGIIGGHFTYGRVSFFSNNNFSSDQHLLNSITVGNGVKDIITYSVLKNGNGVYEAGNSENYPNFDIQSSLEFRVVSQVEKRGYGFNKKQLFRYYDAVTNLHGIGFLGFRSMMRSNWHNDLNSDIISNVSINDFSLRGANIENYSVLGIVSPSAASPSTFISKSILGFNSPSEALQSNKVFKLENKTIQDFDGLNGTSNEVATIYDEYRNPLKITVLIKEGMSLIHKSVTDYTYENSAVPYIIGRPAGKIKKINYNNDQADSEEKYFYNSQFLLSDIKKRPDATANYVTEHNDYDSFGNIISKTLTAGSSSRTASWTYDSSGRFLTSNTDIEGLTTLYTYNTVGTLKTETNPYGQSFSYEYDSWFRRSKATDYLQKSIVYSYLNDRPLDFTTTISKVSSDGSETRELFDDLGRKIQEGGKANVSGVFISKNYAYDIYDRLVLEGVPYQSGSVRYAKFAYDAYGRMKEQTSPGNQITSITYSGLNTFISDGVKNKKITKDAVGNVIEMMETPGGTIKYSYYADGSLKESDFDGAKTKIQKDKWGRRTQLDDSSAGVYKYSYNDFNELVKEENDNGISNYKINPLGKLEEKVITGLNTNSKTIYNYDSTTKLLTSTECTDIQNGSSKITNTYTYDEYKRLYTKVEATPFATFTKTYRYDDYGRVNSETLAAWTPTKSDYKVITSTYLNGAPYQIKDGPTVIWQSNSIDYSGKLGSALLGNGLKLTNTYNGDGFDVSKKYDLGTANLMKFETSFNVSQGNLMSRKNSLFNYPETFDYDSLDRLTEMSTTGQFLNITFSTSDKEGFEVENGAVINSSGLALSAQVTSAGSTVKRTVVTNGKIGDVLFFNFDHRKILGTDNYNVYIEERDPVSGASAKFLKSTITLSNSTVNLTHTISQYSNVILRIEKLNTTSLNVFIIDNVIGQGKLSTFQQYDEKGRITSNYLGTYAYPSSGSIYQNGSISLNNQSLSYYQYRSTQNITYNAFKSPDQIEDLGIEKISFNYNDEGQRIASFYGGTQDKLARPLRKYYSSDGSMEIKHNMTSGVMEFLFYIGGDAYTAPVVYKSDGTSTSGNGSRYYLHRDYLGSIVAVTNQAGEIVEKRLFGAWGDILSVQNGIGTQLSGLTVIDRGYTGHEHLQSVGLINMNGRIFDPKLRRFLQPDNNIQDPFNTQNYNRYGYVMNNPFKYSDPSGEFWNVLFGYLFTAYVKGAYASGGELNPAKWKAAGFTNAALGVSSLGASSVATNFTNNYLDNYNRTPELGVSASSPGTTYDATEDIFNFFPKISASFDKGLNDRTVDIYDFFANDVRSSNYWGKTISDFGSDIMAGRSMLNASDEYKREIFNNMSNMSVYDWAYTAGYSAPDIAASYAVPYAVEGMAARVGAMDFTIARTEAALADDMVRVRHHTGAEALRKIKKSQEIWAHHSGSVHFEVEPFMDASKAHFGQAAKGAYVEFSLPPSSIYRPEVYKGVGNYGELITNGAPFSLKNTKPKFVIPWW